MRVLMLTIELLSFSPATPRALQMLAALERGAGPHARVVRTETYRGGSDVLLLWGPGAPNRFAPMAEQIGNGGHVLALDLAYWDRQRKVRVSIDRAHPQYWVLRHDWPASRLEADGVRFEDCWDPAGPVVVAGIGRKARTQYGDAVEAWEAAQMSTVRTRLQRTLVYRPKQADAPLPPLDGATLQPATVPIDEGLAGASLVITWHSNVAVDALRLGIPVVCHDGAAAAVCPNRLEPEPPTPMAPSVRDRFFRNLAWFQWAPQEASAFWQWTREVLA